MEKIILICGRSGSGKGTLAKYLEERYGASVYRYSDPLFEILHDLAIANTRENLAKISHTLRQNFGENILGIGAHNFIEKHKGDLIVLEGVRRIEGLQDLKDKIDHIIWIDASADIRYARILSRGEKHGENQISREIFDQQEELETEKSLDKIKAISDIVIDNNESIDEFLKKIDTIFNTYK